MGVCKSLWNECKEWCLQTKTCCCVDAYQRVKNKAYLIKLLCNDFIENVGWETREGNKSVPFLVYWHSY